MLRDVCSPVNKMRPGKPGIEAASPASRKVKHTAVYGPSTREDAMPASSLKRAGTIDITRDRK
jgi:hypothetical protein